MKKNLAILLAAGLLLSACAQIQEQSEAQGPHSNESDPNASVLSASPTDRLQGEAAAVQLRGWYNQTVTNCGNPGRPAFLCSGVMIRATLSGQNYLPWDPSPDSITSGGVSFSWLRTDDNFANFFAHHNGFIFYPVMDTPRGKNSDIQVMCSFGHDGGTNHRSANGCGVAPGYPQGQLCHEQNIRTGQQWITHFNSQANKHLGQCGWDTREGQRDTADHFYQGIIGRGLMTDHWVTQNELRLATWETGAGAQLPIQSFFYVAGSAGLALAQDDQRRYQANYGEVVPIIQVTLPASKGQQASFVYRDADQGVSGMARQ